MALFNPPRPTPARTPVTVQDKSITDLLAEVPVATRRLYFSQAGRGGWEGGGGRGGEGRERRMEEGRDGGRGGGGWEGGRVGGTGTKRWREEM